MNKARKYETVVLMACQPTMQFASIPQCTSHTESSSDSFASFESDLFNDSGSQNLIRSKRFPSQQIYLLFACMSKTMKLWIKYKRLLISVGSAFTLFFIIYFELKYNNKNKLFTIHFKCFLYVVLFFPCLKHTMTLL